MELNNQSKSETWINSAGTSMPKDRVFKHEKMSEAAVAQLFKRALSIGDLMKTLKDLCDTKFEAIMRAQSAHNGLTYDSEKSYTMYLFDKSVKITRDVHRAISFNENLLSDSYSVFVQFLAEENAPKILSAMIQSAFKSKNGFDRNKINSILQHRDDPEVKENALFCKAIELLVEAKQEDDVKVYYRFYIREDEDYKMVNLNFSYV